MIHAQKSAGRGLRAYRLGLRAEALCRFALRFKFYTVVATRYKTGQGEIDLIATRGKTLVFVEIKARPDQAQALESIGFRQRARIVRAAHVFLARTPCFNSYALRFDVMSVSRGRFWPTHIVDAFQGSSERR